MAEHGSPPEPPAEPSPAEPAGPGTQPETPPAEPTAPAAPPGGRPAARGGPPALARFLDRRLRAISQEISETLALRFRASLDALQDRTEGALDGLRSSVAGLEDRVSRAVAGLTDVTEARLDAIQTRVGERAGEMRLEAEETLGHIRDEVAALRRETVDRAEAAQAGMDRIAQLSDVIESLGKRRGFRELAETERRLQEQQASFVEQLAGAGRSLASRIQELDQRLTTIGDIAGLESRVSEIGSGFDQRTQEIADALERKVEDLATTVGARLAELSSSVDEKLGHFSAGAVAEQVRESLGPDLEGAREMPANLSRGLEAIRDVVGEVAAAQQAVEEQLRDFVKALGDRTGAIEASVEQAQIQVAERVAAVLDASLESMTAKLGEVTGQVRWDVDETLGGLRDDVKQIRQDADERTATITGALERIDRLGEVIESLGRRRGFRELVETERQLRDEQAAFVEQLVAAGEGLTQRVGHLEQRLEAMTEVADVGARLTEIGEGIDGRINELFAGLQEQIGLITGTEPGALAEEIRALVAEELGAAVDEIGAAMKEGRGRTATAALKEATKVNRDLEKVVTLLRSEVSDLSDRLEAWGKPRTAGRLAEELSGIESRLTEVEQAVHEDIGEAVFDRMQRLFDRRFEALIQLVETRMRQFLTPEELTEERRGGLFRRR